MMERTKQFKTYREQIEILKSKGLVCDDNSIKILERNNYYFLINRYKDCFIIPNSKPNVFRKNTHFNEIVALYNFDNDLRSITLKYIIKIENTLKSIISHEFSKLYGYGYLQRDNFTFDPKNTTSEILEKRIKNLFNSIKSTIAQGKRSHRYIKYYSDNYSQIPLWVVINDLSLGLTIKFYKLLKDQDKENISQKFGISFKDFESYLDILSHFRNLAAHNQRMFDAQSNYPTTFTPYHQKLNITNCSNYMALLIALKILLLKEDFISLTQELNTILIELDNLVYSIPNEPIIKKMGLDKFKQLCEL